MNITESLPERKVTDAQPDPMLRAIAAVPEHSPLELGITLNVKGLIITGFIISQKTYFDALITGLGEVSQDNELKTSLQHFLGELKDKLVSERQTKTANSEQPVLPKLIHLRNVKIYPSEGRGMPTYGDALWRGKIDAVDGFTLGEMVPAQFDNLTLSS